MRINFINISVKLLICSLFFNACQSENSSLLHRKWQSVALSNPQMDEQISFMKHYIDTVGNNDPEIGKHIHLDSLKMVLREELSHILEDQKQMLENTLMNFQSNGVVYITSIDGVDSAMYKLEGNVIIVDEAKLKGYGELMKFEILQLTIDSLKLKSIIYGDTSYVSMIPLKEK